MRTDDEWNRRVELVDPHVLEQIAPADMKAHLQPDDFESPKRYTCRSCGARFAAVHDIVVHEIVEKLNNGFHVPCIVPDETELEDSLEDPEFWEWWVDAAQTLYKEKPKRSEDDLTPEEE
jgi:hypothetical protein